MKGVIVISGAAGGLGAALCRRSLAAGYPIALLGRTKSRLERLKKELDRGFPGIPVTVHAVDLCDEPRTRKTVEDLIRAHRRIRAVINNAGTWMGSETLSSAPAAKIRKSIDLNFFSAFHLTQSVLNRSQAYGELAVINVGATASKDSWPEVFSFCAGKGLLYQYTRALAREVAAKGVHVAHVVVDGMLDNERTRKLNRKLKADRFMKCEALAADILRVVEQDRSCWTLEWDARPYLESF